MDTRRVGMGNITIFTDPRSVSAGTQATAGNLFLIHDHKSYTGGGIS